jgi:SAM-dependent methyltransferase
VADTDYEYRGLHASTWDLLRGDTSGWPDRVLFRDLILQSGQPALDVGCATGRLVLDYLAEGLDVDGVDLSPEMLSICREKARARGLQPSLYLQEMERLDLPRCYRTIIVASKPKPRWDLHGLRVRRMWVSPWLWFSSFQLVTDRDAAAEAMRRFFGHLGRGGTLVMPFMLLYTGESPGPIVGEDWKLIRERVRPEDGALVRRWSRSTYDLTQ